MSTKKVMTQFIFWIALISPLNQILNPIHPPTHQNQRYGQPTVLDLNFLDTSSKPVF